MPQLTIELNGKTYTAPKPKTKLWRQIAKFQDENNGKGVTEVMEEAEDLICLAFNDPDVTRESIEENLDLDELMPKFQEVVNWVNTMINSKVQQLPNETTPAAN